MCRLSDPYLKITLGGHTDCKRDKFKPNFLDPEFFESFEFYTEMPGDAKLKVEVWDRDALGFNFGGGALGKIGIKKRKVEALKGSQKSKSLDIFCVI